MITDYIGMLWSFLWRAAVLITAGTLAMLIAAVVFAMVVGALGLL